MQISIAGIEDAPEILALQKLAFYQEACRCGNFRIHPMIASLEDLERTWADHLYVKTIEEGRIVASARGIAEDGVCRIGNVIVRPDRQGRGLGKAILKDLESRFPKTRRFELFTAAASASNIAFYRGLGYSIFRVQAPSDEEPEMVFMEKIRLV